MNGVNNGVNNTNDCVELTKSWFLASEVDVTMVTMVTVDVTRTSI